MYCISCTETLRWKLCNFYFYKNWLGCLVSTLRLSFPVDANIFYWIKTCAHVVSPAHLQIYSSRTFQRFPCSSPWFPMVPTGSPWLSLVIVGYTQLSVVILGYTLYLVIYDSNICEIVCAFAIIFPIIFRNLLQSRLDKMTMR